MDDAEKRTLESMGWTPEMLEALKPTPATTAVDAAFLDATKRVLAQAGQSPLEFLAANPRLTISQLAQRLRRGASAVGLAMALYEEATETGVVRDTAKEVLLREILQRFPEGWSSEGNIHPAVKIGPWDYEIRRYVADPLAAKRASQIMRHLTIDHPPPYGWKPHYPNDALIDEIFDLYWPPESRDASGGPP